MIENPESYRAGCRPIMRSVDKIGLLLCVLCTVAAVIFISAQRNTAATAIDRTPVETQQPNPDIMAIAHRGAAKLAPENTLAAFAKAIELRYAYMELDVRYTRDRIPVIMHDATVDRTTNGTGLLSEFTLDELRQLDAGSWFSTEFTHTRVPTLQEVLAVAKGRICIVWDTKEPPDAATVELFQSYGFERDCLLATFGGFGQHGYQAPVTKLLRYWPSAPLIGKARGIADLDEQLDSYPMIRAVMVNYRNVDAELINAAHNRGLLVISSTLHWADHPKIYQKLIDAGLDMLMLDQFTALNDYLATGNVDVPLQDPPPNDGFPNPNGLSAAGKAEADAL